MYFVMHLMCEKPFKGDIDLILSAKLQRPSGSSIAFFVAATLSCRSSTQKCPGLEKTTPTVMAVCSAPLTPPQHWVDFALSVYRRRNKLSIFTSMQKAFRKWL